MNGFKTDGPIYVDVYMPHSASSGTPCLICELSQLDSIINAANPGSVITILKGNFVLNGHFDEQMRNAFQSQFSNGEDWWVLEGTFYPYEAEILASGSSWSNIESELMEEPERLNKILCGLLFCHHPGQPH